MKLSKRILSVILALVLLFTLAACSSGGGESASNGSGTSGDSSAGGDDSLKIGCLVFQEDMFMSLFDAGAQASAADYGVEINSANSSNDATRESEVIRTWTEQGLDGAVVLSPDMSTSLQTFSTAIDSGMTIVTADDQYEKNGSIDKGVLASVTTMPEDLGRASGEAAVKYIQENMQGQDVKIGIIQFKAQAASASEGRSNGFLAALDDAGIEYEVVADQDAWLQDTAVTTATDMLTANPDINILYAANDGGTVGTTMAVRNLGLGDKVAVFGTDASEQICDMVLDESYRLIATTGQDAYQNGYTCAEILIKSLLGEDVSEYEGKLAALDGLPLSRDDLAEVEEYKAKLEELT